MLWYSDNYSLHKAIFFASSLFSCCLLYTSFQRVALKAGEAKTIEFKLTTDDLAFYGRDLVKKAEKGDFNVWVGGHSNATLKGTFSVTE